MAEHPNEDPEERWIARRRGRAAAERLYWAVVAELHRTGASRLMTVTVADGECETIARASGAPLANVQLTWPLVVEALTAERIDRVFVRAAAAATIAAETYTFASEIERGDRAYFQRYDGRRDLGNTARGDGYKYRGRGLIQITGRANYEKYGKKLGLDLVGDPDRALQLTVATRILAAYFVERRIDALAEREDWLLVRRRVNGGTGNWAKYAGVLRALLPHTVIPDIGGLSA